MGLKQGKGGVGGVLCAEGGKREGGGGGRALDRKLVSRIQLIAVGAIERKGWGRIPWYKKKRCGKKHL